MKKWKMCFAIMAVTGTFSLCADPTAPSPQVGGSVQTGGCSMLTTDEQAFAAQLSDPANRAMFCSEFTAEQRQQAMGMMTGSMTADQAVQQVMQKGSTRSSPARRSGGCPAKQ